MRWLFKPFRPYESIFNRQTLCSFPWQIKPGAMAYIPLLGNWRILFLQLIYHINILPHDVEFFFIHQSKVEHAYIIARCRLNTDLFCNPCNMWRSILLLLSSYFLIIFNSYCWLLILSLICMCKICSILNSFYLTFWLT